MQLICYLIHLVFMFFGKISLVHGPYASDISDFVDLDEGPVELTN